MGRKVFYLSLIWLFVGAHLFAQQPWSFIAPGDIINNNAGDIGIGTTKPAAKVHITGYRDWGLMIQNNNSSPEQPFNESTFMIKEPLSDTGNFFSLVVGSGPAAAVELSAIRQSDGTGRTIDIRTGRWSWIFGNSNYINFDANGVAAFGTTASTAAGKQVEIRASVTSDDALRIRGVGFQTGKLIRIQDDFGNQVFNVGNSGNVGIGTDAPSAKLHVTGNFIATGTKSALVGTASFGKRRLYAVESPENWFEDFGSAKLIAGHATVKLDPIFVETVNTHMEYHVFLTPHGECLVSVVDKTPTSFGVQQVFGTDPHCQAEYRIVAKRRGYENVRLEEMP